MRIDCGASAIREYRQVDLEALVANANDPAVARNMRDVFPQPYTLEAAVGWLAFVGKFDPPEHFAIEHAGEFCGGIGFFRKQGDAKFTAELGYWLGQRFWSRGILSAVLGRFAEHVFANTDLLRLEAQVLPWNPASARVLVKAGFEFEGTLRRSMLKDGVVRDMQMFSRVRPDRA